MPLLVLALTATTAASAQTNKPGLEFFESKIRPLLVEECFSCHSAKSKPLMGGLRLDSRASFMKGGPRGVLISAGSLDKSLLFRAVSYTDPDLKMPPKGRLSPDKIVLLNEWIKVGAPYPEDAKASSLPSKKPVFDFAARAKHWSFQPLKRPSIPQVKDVAWAKTPIDRFILAKLEAAGMKPAPPADRRTLLRRVTFDMTGLPPTLAEIKAFVDDRSPDAYLKVVDRLLASPHYGERWARHWLDVVRFAETDGHEFDTDKPGAFEYRDYVIRALNADVSFDQFAREHVAGDLMPNPRRHPTEEFNESIIGTGFWFLGEAKHSPVDLLVDEAERVDNQIDVFGRAFLGLSVGCARCHDHKFDPIPTRDYYALSGFMKSSRYQLAAIDPQNLNWQPIRDLQRINKQLIAAATKPALARLRFRLVDLPRVLLAADEAPGQSGRILGLTSGEALGSALNGWSRYLSEAARDINDPLYPWIKLTGGETQTSQAAFNQAKADLLKRMRIADAAAAQSEASETLFEDFRKPTYSGWYMTGAAFGAGPTAHAIRVARRDNLAVIEMLASVPAADSGQISDRLQGSLRSGTFIIQKPKILYRMNGMGCQLRLVVDNFQRIRDPIYGGLEINVNNGRRPGVFIQDVSKWIGHRAYVEIVDPGAGFISVQRISFGDHAPAERPNPEILKLLESATITSPESLAEEYGKLFSRVMDRLADESARTAFVDDPLVAIADWLVTHQNLIHSNSLDSSGLTEDKIQTVLLLQQAEAEVSIKQPRKVMSLADGTGENDKVHVRGNPKVLTDEAPRRFLQVCGGSTMAIPAPDQGSGRMALAEHLTGPNDPLLPRVIVNRVWQHHFGEGIVRTPDDFGLRGEKPTHPELLEWLAATFVARSNGALVSLSSGNNQAITPSLHHSNTPIGVGWSLKSLHRMIVLSNTYQMSSRPDESSDAKDPQNRLLHRANIRRLEAEVIRDSILAVSGRLDRKLYGPSVMPYLTSFMEGRGRPEKSGPLDGDGRRSIYLSVRRNFLNPMFLAFDYPVPFNTMGKRAVSNVPAQALTMLNNPFVVSQADVWAKRALAERSLDAAKRIAEMYEAAYGRPPTANEVNNALAFLADQDKQYGKTNDPRSWEDLCHVLYNVKEFIFVN